MPVGSAPGSCSCGNPAGLVCDLCRVGMCQDCDVLSRAPADLAAWPVQIAGFGYLNRVWDYRYAYLQIKHRDGHAYGPFLYLNELLSSLSSAHGLGHRNGARPVRHLCWPCLRTAIPETAERIASGTMCETPGCVADPCERCRCCGGAFCEQCLTVTRPRGAVPCRLTWLDPADKTSGDSHTLYPIGAVIERGVVPGALHGLCGICGAERYHRQRDLAAELVAAHYAGVLVPSPPAAEDGADDGTLTFRLPAEKRRTRKGREEERARAGEVLRRCAAEIAGELTRLPVGRRCDRARAFAQGKTYAYYAVLDERSRTAPAAITAS